jgi:hypothetical protein
MFDSLLPEYGLLLENLKIKIHEAQLKAALSVNAQMTVLYWEIGQLILAQQKQLGWGARVIDQLSGDLSRSSPN